ncbi:hypothetical protein DFH09DRAFT_1067465 [Mycena vulgaris]|nr:hypothetical protein DFH09DRAFT_1067465 [Mycena vulgaris]
MPPTSALLSFAFTLLVELFTLFTAQPLPLSTLTLTKRTSGPPTAVKVGIVIAVSLIVGITLIFLCCAKPSARPIPEELADEVGVLRARVQQLEGESTGAGTAKASAAPPPIYTP